MRADPAEVVDGALVELDRASSWRATVDALEAMLSMPDLASVIAALSDVERRQVADRIAWSRADRAAHPLAWARLWDRDPPRTSQRRAAQAMLEQDLLVGLALGGNRAGKSELGAQITSATLLGRAHPTTLRWADLNGLDVSSLPLQPEEVWSIAVTSGDSIAYVRPKLAKYLPSASKWRNQFGHGEAEVTTPDGSICRLKAQDQQRRAFQGGAINLAWVDEELEDRGIHDEVLMRLVDYHGRYLGTMTPLRGMTWTHAEYIERFDRDPQTHILAGPEHRVAWIHGEDNPWISRRVLDRVLGRFGAHQRAARARGEFVALEGRVYSAWDQSAHVIPDRPIPESWLRYAGIDWGTANPTAILWAALDPADNVLHVYDEWYQSGTTISARAAAIRQREAMHRHPPFVEHPTPGLEVELRWADPAQADVSVSLTREHDIDLVPASKAVEDGILAVLERLIPDANGHPHVLVHRRCVNLRRELDGYTRDDAGKPRKVNDHACDALRYLCIGVGRLHPLYS